MATVNRPYRPPRPSKYRYDFSHLVQFPRRLLFPPNAGVGTVRSLKIKPRYEVALNDVLEGKHLPPITLKDFEEYLVFVEHSAENLYFICWLRDYKVQYRAWEQSIAHIPADSEKRPKSLPELTLSFARARATFFDNASSLELNLPAQDVQEMLTAAKGYPHPPPSVLSEVEKQVEGMLQQSLMRFVGCSCGNSGRRRGLFAIVVGLAAMAVGLIPVLLSIYHDTSRGVRLAGIPAFWFGAMTAIAGFHGVCVVIFLFGDARQLYPYEMQRPLLEPLEKLAPLELPLPVTAPTPKHHKSDASSVAGKTMTGPGSEDEHSSQAMINVSSRYSADDHAIIPTMHQNEKPTSGEWESLTTAGFIPTYPASISSTTFTTTTVAAPHYANNRMEYGTSIASSQQPLHFDFDSLPTQRTPKRASDWGGSDSSSTTGFPERGVFTSLTKVLSPLVTRAQWDIVVRSAVFAVFVAVAFGFIMYAIPPRH